MSVAWEACDVLLAFHGESQSGRAWRVSIDGDERGACWIPKSLTVLGEACGGLERFGDRGRRLIVPIHEATVPLWLAVEKGFL